MDEEEEEEQQQEDKSPSMRFHFSSSASASGIVSIQLASSANDRPGPWDSKEGPRQRQSAVDREQTENDFQIYQVQGSAKEMSPRLKISALVLTGNLASSCTANQPISESLRSILST